MFGWHIEDEMLLITSNLRHHMSKNNRNGSVTATVSCPQREFKISVSSYWGSPIRETFLFLFRIITPVLPWSSFVVSYNYELNLFEFDHSTWMEIVCWYHKIVRIQFNNVIFINYVKILFIECKYADK